MRYQKWWNYGGPLEWTWEQYLSSNTNLRPVYHYINTDIQIYNAEQQSHESDTNSNGCVDQTELTNYIPRWYAGTATMQNLMSAIALWIDNIGC